MDWLNAHAFWWLASLSIPLIIHLLSKKRQRVVKIGSTRFISPSESMSSKSIHFTQWILFLVRCLIIVLLVMIVAKPIMNRSENQASIYIEDVVAAVLEENETYEQKWMNNNDKFIFSITGDQNPPGEFINYWTLIHYLNEQGKEATVYSDNTLSKFSGSTEPLSPLIEWVVVPRKENITLMDTIHGSEGAIPIQYTSSDELLKYEIGTRSSSNFSDTTSIKIRSSYQSTASIQPFELAIQAMNKQIPWEIKILDVSDPDWIILIDTTAFIDGSKHIEYYPKNEQLKFQKTSDLYYQLSGSLSLKTLTYSDFLDQWTALVISDHLNIGKYDRRQITGLPFNSKGKKQFKINQATGQSVENPLWIVFFLLIIIERYLAHKKPT